MVYMFCIDVPEFTKYSSVSCTANLNSSSGEGDTGFVEWWTLVQTDPNPPVLATNYSDSLEIYVYSEQVVPPIFSTISGLGYVFQCEGGYVQ